MKRESITIDLTHPKKSVVVLGQVPKSRLTWQADGLDIYIVGSVGKRFPAAGNIAMNECLNRNISLMTLRIIKR